MRFVAVVLVIITLFSAEMYFNSVRNLDSCYNKLEDAGYKFDELAEFGPSNCRVKKPIKLYSLPKTTLNTPITLSCPFAKRVGDWASDINAKSISHVGGYNCRKIAGSPFMSQHSYGKAIDIVKINGVAISDEWKEATASACKHFNNVLGPGSDKAHANHLHLDSGFGRPCWAKDTLKF